MKKVNIQISQKFETEKLELVEKYESILSEKEEYIRMLEEMMTLGQEST